MRILHSKKLVFISKPRCGSTSVRNFLTKNCQAGDIICNTVDPIEGLHPHMSATAVKKYLEKKGIDSSEYKFFTVTRHPLEMLWSYFKYFKPDSSCRYNFNENHDSNNLMSFENWLENGHVGIGKYWIDYVPSFVTGKDFTPLSLEAHICNESGSIDVDQVFYLESLNDVESWLGNFFENPVEIPKVNGTEASDLPMITDKVLVELRKQFPMENEYYKF